MLIWWIFCTFDIVAKIWMRIIYMRASRRVCFYGTDDDTFSGKRYITTLNGGNENEIYIYKEREREKKRRNK